MPVNVEEVENDRKNMWRRIEIIVLYFLSVVPSNLIWPILVNFDVIKSVLGSILTKNEVFLYAYKYTSKFFFIYK